MNVPHIWSFLPPPTSSPFLPSSSYSLATGMLRYGAVSDRLLKTFINGCLTFLPEQKLAQWGKAWLSIDPSRLGWIAMGYRVQQEASHSL